MNHNEEILRQKLIRTVTAMDKKTLEKLSIFIAGLEVSRESRTEKPAPPGEGE